jgi:hypothetical protein
VTKWVHLNWGDDGLITLFSKIWGLLLPVIVIYIIFLQVLFFFRIIDGIVVEDSCGFIVLPPCYMEWSLEQFFQKLLFS